MIVEEDDEDPGHGWLSRFWVEQFFPRYEGLQQH
jgi:hypothetical protein